MKNVCFIMQDRRTVYGAERATLELARGLKGEGVAVHMCLIEETRLGDDQSEFREQLVLAGLPVVSVRTDRPFSRRLVQDLNNVVQEQDADVVHTIGPKATLHAYLALKRSPVMLISTLHGWLCRPDLKERLHEAIELFALRRFDRVVVLSRYYRDLLLNRGLKSEQVVLIPTGLAESSAEGDGLLQEKPTDDAVVFGMLGRLSSEKNHDLFLRAVSDSGVQPGEAHFLIGGAGPLYQHLQDEVADLRLGDRLEFTGYVDPLVFLRRIDVLVLCSKIENLPYSVLEAMAVGVPTIATAVGGLPDLIDDEVTGLLFPAGDALALTQCLQLMIDSPERRSEMGVKAREKLQREFSLKRCVAANIELYERGCTR